MLETQRQRQTKKEETDTKTGRDRQRERPGVGMHREKPWPIAVARWHYKIVQAEFCRVFRDMDVVAVRACGSTPLYHH